MADNTQDTEMEDILSSIKNILEEDEQKQTAKIKADNEDVDIVKDVLATSPDDIIELSPDMRLQEVTMPNFEQTEETDEIESLINTSTDASLSLDFNNDVSIDLNDLSDSSPVSFSPALDNNDDISKEMRTLNIGIEDIDSDSFFEESSQEHIPLSLEGEKVTQIDKIEIAPQVVAENMSSPTNSEEETPQVVAENMSSPTNSEEETRDATGSCGKYVVTDKFRKSRR